MMIRPATAEDIHSLMQLAGETPTAAHWTEKQFEAALRSGPPKRAILVLDCDGVQGFTVGAEVAGEWELENIVVAAAYQRRGLGRKLLKALMSRVEEEKGICIFLEVRESNSNARALYESLGFEPTGTRPGYYHNPVENAVLYRKNLGPAAPEIG